MVPTIVMGRGALLVRQVVDQGTVAKVFSTVNDIGTNPLDLSATSSSVESLLQQEQQQQRLIQHLNSFLPQNLFQLHQQQQQQHVLLQQVREHIKSNMATISVNSAPILSNNGPWAWDPLPPLNLDDGLEKRPCCRVKFVAKLLTDPVFSSVTCAHTQERSLTFVRCVTRDSQRRQVSTRIGNVALIKFGFRIMFSLLLATQDGSTAEKSRISVAFVARGSLLPATSTTTR